MCNIKQNNIVCTAFFVFVTTLDRCAEFPVFRLAETRWTLVDGSFWQSIDQFLVVVSPLYLGITRLCDSGADDGKRLDFLFILNVIIIITIIYLYIIIWIISSIGEISRMCATR